VRRRLRNVRFLTCLDGPGSLHDARPAEHAAS